MCVGVITLFVIIYQGYSPGLVRAISQEELEAEVLCATSVWSVITTGLTGGHWRFKFSEEEKFKLVVTPIHPL
jgi:hypothetical protein